MTTGAEYIKGVTTHTRRGAIAHRFKYTVDYVLIDAEGMQEKPKLFSRNRFNLMSVYDRDHGGPLKAGTGAKWVRDILAAHGLTRPHLRILLLTQPRVLGYIFNPVSFWLVLEGKDMIAAIAEVSTPFGDRHSYLCHQPDLSPITADTRITTPKALHVSPFQEVAGTYEFSFDIRAEKISIRILHRNGDEGVVACLAGPRVPMTNARLINASLRRPLGALRTMILIHWQALRLKLKGAKYRTRPAPPTTEVT
ncbi:MULTISPECIES: DUF1365 domain-containing protein [Falsihalocynthiibacter]|uniref:DUF1365 domain-containing protein n=1 Tax=Falsihalocynthiibacter TaxID=2854182 RepID=UPI0030032F41